MEHVSVLFFTVFVLLGMGIPTAAQSPSITSACGDDGRRYDIVFILDDSDSVDSTEWSNQRTFCSYMIDRFSIGSDKVLVGAIQVHDSVDVILNPGSQTTASGIKSAINNATQRNGTTSNYGVGASYAYNTMLANYRRSDSIRVVIGMSDDTQDHSSTMDQLFSAGDNDSTIFLLVSWDTSNPSYARVDYFLNNVSYSTSTANAVAAKVCPTCGDDGREIDIIFAIDHSGSVGSSDWIKEKEYIYAIIDQMAVSTNRVLIGALLITNSYQLVYNIGDCKTGTDCKAAIESLSSPTGGSDYEQGAYYAYHTMLANYRRPGSLGVIIGLTDDSTGIGNMSYISTALSNGDYFYMVGVGGDKSPAATSSSFYWDVNTWSDLTTVMADEAAAKICPYCTNPSPKFNAAYTKEGLMYLDTASYTCNTRYIASTSSNTITCQKNGTWTSTSLMCSLNVSTSYICEPETGGRSQSCVILSDFDNYQYAYCITNDEVLSRTNNTLQCKDTCRNYCLLTCMAERHGVIKGNVTTDCLCYPTETTDAATQLSSWCLNPQGQINFFDDCFPSTYLTCKNITEMRTALKSQAEALYNGIDSEENCTAKSWLRDVRICVQAELITELKNGTTCDTVINTVYPDLYRICLYASFEGYYFCDLQQTFRDSFINEFFPLISDDVKLQINATLQVLQNC